MITAKKTTVAMVLFFTFLFSTGFCFAQMSSGSYKINADSLSAGGLESGSASYKLNDTMGEAAIGEGTSASYKTKAGFWYMTNTYLTLAVDGNNENLGTLLAGSPVTGQTIVSVTTDSWNGYNLQVHEDHPMRHTDTVTEISDHNGTIATPLLWESPNHQGFGFSITSGTNVDPKWGSTPNFKYAAFPGSAATAHAKEDYQSATDSTTFGYKADVIPSQKSGAYSCTVTYTAVGSI
ncbi:MAG: hypothetical protein QMD77_01910 [Patescibacteria group bacterium]|nr:hypothetical protein [Patescibacteria group bacterium]